MQAACLFIPYYKVIQRLDSVLYVVEITAAKRVKVSFSLLSTVRLWVLGHSSGMKRCLQAQVGFYCDFIFDFSTSRQGTGEFVSAQGRQISEHLTDALLSFF